LIDGKTLCGPVYLELSFEIKFGPAFGLSSEKKNDGYLTLVMGLLRMHYIVPVLYNSDYMFS
jgi:hypothetical protein